MPRNDEWSYSVDCGVRTQNALQSRFISQYTYFQNFDVEIHSLENFNAKEFFMQISHYHDYQLSRLVGHCVREIVSNILISGKCIYHFHNKNIDWKFVVPTELGGPKQFAKNVLLLKDFTLEKTKLYMQNFQENKANRYLNLERMNEEHIIAASKAFASWGFNLLNPSDVTGFYLAYEHLKQERAKAILRDYVLSEIEKNLIKMGFNVKFKVLKVHTQKDFDVAIEKLQQGTLTSIDAMNIKEAFA